MNSQKPSCSLFLMALLHVFAASDLGAPSALGSSTEPSGEEVMRRAEAQQEGWEDETATLTFLMIDKGETNPSPTVISRRRKNYRGKNGLHRNTSFFFASPPKFRRIAYLRWSFAEDGREDDQWLFNLPGPTARKVIRPRYDPESRFLKLLFHGIDFTYEDLADRQLAQDTHRLLRRDVLNYKPCYIVESLPRAKTYSSARRVSWVGIDRGLPIKVEHYDGQGKVIRTLFHHYWTEAQGVWFPRQSVMKDHQREHMTLMYVNEIQFNTGLTDGPFQPANLPYLQNTR